MAKLKTKEDVEQHAEDLEPVMVENEEDMSENVKESLKAFSNQEKLYVNEANGVFSVDTEKHIRGNAILYKNPYFKK